MNMSMFVENQLLATKFYVPVTPGILIPRPRLTSLLDESLKRPFTLVSAPAGFGKTTLLATWTQLQPTSNYRVAWVSLDEEDNAALQFWIYVLSALSMQQPERFTPLLKYLQSPQAPPLKYVLAALSNLVWDSTEDFVLILDDYHTIIEQEVHATLSYLLEYLPPQLHIILATRTDPPLQLALLRARGLVLEIRTNQLRCTTEETKTIFQELMGIQLPEETIQEVMTRTEGWLVGLQLLGLSLPGYADPGTLLEEVSGDQRYILDFLTEEVLRRQSQEVQTFLLCTCILERFSASLCDAVLEQTGSQQMLQQLERTNLFVVSLDSKREWYRYHALFAQALHTQLEQMHSELVPLLHYRASIWHAEHNQSTQAILHALHAHQWEWAADLIERLPLLSLTWGASEHELVLLRQWFEQLPNDIVRSRPRLCVASAQLLWAVASSPMEDTWLDAAEATLTALLTNQGYENVSFPTFVPQVRQEQEDLLAEIIATRAFLRSFQENGEVALLLCQQHLTSLSIKNGTVRVLAAYAQIRALYASSANDAQAAAQVGLEAGVLAHNTGNTVFEIVALGTTAMYMVGTGKLHEIYRLTQQAILLGTKPEGLVVPDIGWPSLWQADILREWNQLDEALKLAEEAASLAKQTRSITSLIYVLCGYAVLLRIHLSCGNLEAARSALQHFERMGMSMNQHVYLHMCSLFTTVDRVRLWLADGEVDRAMHWVKELDIGQRHGSPFSHEREEVARARIFLAKEQPAIVLERLMPVLERATTGQRWSHVIEIRLLQALAYQMLREESLALSALSEAIRLAEPEGFIRSFVDEGYPIAALLFKLQKQQGKDRLTPYLDTLLAAFPSQRKLHRYPVKQPRRRIK